MAGKFDYAKNLNDPPLETPLGGGLGFQETMTGAPLVHQLIVVPGGGFAPIGLGKFGRNAPGDKAVVIAGKLYTNDRAHIYALEHAAHKMGFKDLEEALQKRPDIFEIQNPQQFGEIDANQRFVPMPNDEGSLTYEDYMTARDLGD